MYGLSGATASACSYSVSLSRQVSSWNHVRTESSATTTAAAAQADEPRAPAPLDAVGDGPHDGDEDADQRNVRVAVGVRLHSHLHDADHGHQHAQIPEPAGEQIGRRRAERSTSGGGDEQEEARDRASGQIDVRRHRIEHAELRRPQRHPEVAQVRERRVREALGQRQVRERLHRPRLRAERDHARREGQREQRRLLERELAEPRELGAHSGARRRAAPERPVIEQQQHEGQRHQHRLGHQAERIEPQHARVAPCAPPLEPARVGADREQEEERAQHVLARGDPGDRLDVQRVEGEQRRHDRAARRAAGQARQQQEQDDGVRGVKGDVHQVERSRRHAPELGVEQVREQRQRMPVVEHRLGEGPGDSGPAQPLADIGMLQQVCEIVIVDELEGPDLREDDPHRRHQQRRPQQRRPDLARAVGATRRRRPGRRRIRHLEAVEAFVRAHSSLLAVRWSPRAPAAAAPGVAEEPAVERDRVHIVVGEEVRDPRRSSQRTLGARGGRGLAAECGFDLIEDLRPDLRAVPQPADLAWIEARAFSESG